MGPQRGDGADSAGLAEDLRQRGKLDLSECFIDGTFVMAKRGSGVEKTKRGKSSKVMAAADGLGLPVAISATSTTPHEVTLVELMLQADFVGDKPQRLVGNRAFDSDPLDECLRGEGIAMIALHRSNRRKPPTQDERSLRRYRRRCKVENYSPGYKTSGVWWYVMNGIWRIISASCNWLAWSSCSETIF